MWLINFMSYFWSWLDGPYYFGFHRRCWGYILQYSIRINSCATTEMICKTYIFNLWLNLGYNVWFFVRLHKQFSVHLKLKSFEWMEEESCVWQFHRSVAMINHGRSESNFVLCLPTIPCDAGQPLWLELGDATQEGCEIIWWVEQ